MTISAQTRRIKIGKSAKFLARAEDRGRSSLLLKQTVVGGILRRTAAMMRRTHNNMAASIFLLVVVSLMVGGARGVANSRNATNRQNSKYPLYLPFLWREFIKENKKGRKRRRKHEKKKVFLFSWSLSWSRVCFLSFFFFSWSLFSDNS